MKKIIGLSIFIFSFFISYGQIPNSATISNSQTKYQIPNMFATLSAKLPVIDTTNNKATPYVGALTILPSDTLNKSVIPPIYITNGRFWGKIAGGGGGTGVDSVTFPEQPTRRICIWSGGFSQCYSIGGYYDSTGYNRDSTYYFHFSNGSFVDSVWVPFTHLYARTGVTGFKDTTYFGVRAQIISAQDHYVTPDSLYYVTLNPDGSIRDSTQWQGGASVQLVNNNRIVFSANNQVKDTSTLVYDRSNGNVGIGLTTPLQKLDVNGQLKVGLGNTSSIYARSDAGQLSIFSTTTATNGAYILLNAANSLNFSDSGSALINYGNYLAVAPTNSLLRFRYITNGRAYDNLSANASGYVGINTNSAHNPLSVEPRKYSIGQASQSGATVTGVGTTWTIDMVGDYFKWPSQTFPADRITAVNSTTSITLALGQPVGNATVSDYEILRVGMQVTPMGAVGIGTATPNTNAALDIVSTTKGVLMPRMTTTQKNAITSPSEGLEVYDLTLHQKSYWNGTTWINY